MLGGAYIAAMITKHKIKSACFMYGCNAHPVDEIHLACYFPLEVSIATFEEVKAGVLKALVKLAGVHSNLKEVKRVTIQDNGIMFEGEGWRVIYGAETGETFSDTIFCHQIVDAPHGV